MAYVPWGRRALAFIIDFLLMQPYFVAGGLLSKTIGGTGGIGVMYFCAGLGIWANFYNKCIRMGSTGQSWGKQIMGFDLISEPRNAPMGLWKAVLREAAHMADIVTLGIGYVLPVWDGKRQTLADKIMKTVAVEHSTVPAVAQSSKVPAYAG
jgi:uncharacterized RDD family membrane protein YckC